MAQSARMFPLRRSALPEESARQELLKALSRTRALMNQAYGDFNNTSDQDLIESYVFEINALRARYNYLLRRVKELGEAT